MTINEVKLREYITKQIINSRGDITKKQLKEKIKKHFNKEELSAKDLDNINNESSKFSNCGHRKTSKVTAYTKKELVSLASNSTDLSPSKLQRLTLKELCSLVFPHNYPKESPKEIEEFSSKNCGPRKSKKFPDAYSKAEIISLAMKTFPDLSESKANRMTIAKLCESINSGELEGELKKKKVEKEKKKAKKVAKKEVEEEKEHPCPSCDPKDIECKIDETGIENLPCIKRAILKAHGSEKNKIKDYQLRVVKHMLTHVGLLVWHSMGSGKTLTAVVSSQCLLDKYPKMKVIVVTPTSLQGNFKKEMKFYGLKPDDKRYIFLTTKSFYLKYKKLKDFSHFNDKLLIIDEAHVIKTEVKEGKRPKGLISKIFLTAAQNSFRVILLTGTPMPNRPSEIVNLIAMVDKEPAITQSQFSNYMFSKSGNVLDQEDFDKYFKCKVSMFKCPKTEGYPEVMDKEKYFTMSKNYYEGYYDVQEKQAEKFSHLFGGSSDLTMFYNGIRRAVNNIEEERGPKLNFIMKKIKNGVEKGQKTVVYSTWLAAGIHLLEKRLKEERIGYDLIVGTLSKDKRDEVVKNYNSGKIKVLLISKAGGLGLDLKATKYLFIMEPSWNKNDEDQVKARAIRFGSHANVDDKSVIVYKLYMAKPEERISGDDMESVDIILRDMGVEKQKIIDLFEGELSRLTIENMDCDYQ